MTKPELSAAQLARYLRRSGLKRSAPAVHALGAEINRKFPADEATPRLLEP